MNAIIVYNSFVFKSLFTTSSSIVMRIKRSHSSSRTLPTRSYTRTRRSGRSNSLNFNTTIDTDASRIVDPNIEAFVRLLQQINDYLIETDQSYIFQIYSKPRLLYDKIGTLSALLRYDTEGEMIAVLRALGLCRKHGAVIFLKHRLWQNIEERVDSFWYHKQYGNERHNLISLGGNNPSISLKDKLWSQSTSKVPAINEGWILQFKNAVSNMRVDIPVEAAPCINEANAVNENGKRPPGSIEFVYDDNFDFEATKRRKNNRRERYTMIGGNQYQMPNGYVHCHKNTMIARTEEHQFITAVRGAAKKQRQHHDLRNILLIGLTAARFPQVPDVVVEQMMANGVMTVLSRLELLDTDIDDSKGKPFDFDCATRISPCRTTIHNYYIEAACHKIIHNAIRMENAEAVFVVADKGSSILAKAGYFYDDEEEAVVEVNLDFDTAGDDAKSGGEAIKHSFAKYKVERKEQKMIAGGGSDSGGGFTGMAMKNSFVAAGIANAVSYIHVHCTHHNDQTALRNGVESIYSVGGLEERNVAQLIHSFSDVQKSIETAQFNTMMKTSWRRAHPGVEPPKEYTKRMQEPILTRWKTVGEGCRYINKFFDVLLSFGTTLCGHVKNNSCRWQERKKSDMCSNGIVSSSYAKKMAERRVLLQEKAQREGQPARSKTQYNEDITRGPGLVKNVMNFSLQLKQFVVTTKSEIGENAYNVWFQRVKEAVTSLPKQGSYVRYEKDVARFEAALDVEYNRSAREHQSGVTKTPHMESKIPWHKLRMVNNTNALIEECTARRIATISAGEGNTSPGQN